ncbi:MAG: acyltransferase [Candidatus Latescibacteria bacterium]|nr:acyltransferase [Candidatus Latescibacterota bacterium]
MGNNVWVGYDAIIETAHPSWISIGNNVTIGIRCTILAHFWKCYMPEKGDEKNFTTVRIGDYVHIGSRSLILPNVTIGQGSVIAAGSVVTRSVPSRTMVKGNPAKPVAICGIPLTPETPMKEFLLHLKPIKKRKKKNH